MLASGCDLEYVGGVGAELCHEQPTANVKLGEWSGLPSNGLRMLRFHRVNLRVAQVMGCRRESLHTLFQSTRQRQWDYREAHRITNHIASVERGIPQRHTHIMWKLSTSCV